MDNYENSFSSNFLQVILKTNIELIVYLFFLKEKSSPNNKIMKKITDTINNSNALKILIDLDPLFNIELIRKILLFQLVNEYWK